MATKIKSPTKTQKTPTQVQRPAQPKKALADKTAPKQTSRKGKATSNRRPKSQEK